MRKLFILAIPSIFFVWSMAFPADKEDFQFRKQPEIQQIKPKKPVRIKLKRAADGKYTWELTGDDVDEVVRVDRRLRKLLKIE